MHLKKSVLAELILRIAEMTYSHPQIDGKVNPF